MVFIKKVLIVIFCLGLWSVYGLVPSNTKLELVHVVFRHGERTTFNFYPKDPHQNQTFHPYGLSALTNNGKMMMYKLGEFLRLQYGNFLGDDDYLQDKIVARSTGTSRTIMSANLVLAGLYPPSDKLKWHPMLLWQPIPVFSKPFDEEDLLDAAYCQLRNKMLSNLPKNTTIKNLYIEPFQELFSYVQDYSGLNITDLRDLLQIYFILKAESDFGLKLPEWTKTIYPEPLHSSASWVYEFMNSYPILKQIHSGYLLKKIIDDSVAKVNNKLEPHERKAFLYSGHEATLANLLYSLKVFKPRHVPSYGSAIMFELHKHQQDYYVTIKYLQHPLSPSIQTLTLPGCDSLCPLKRFIELNIELLPKMSFEETCKLRVQQ